MATQIEQKFTRIYLETLESDKYITVNRGGTRSSKTYSICQLAFNWLINPTWKGTVWSICRATLPALKATALRDFREIVINAGMDPFIKQNRSELTFEFHGKIVEFFSLDDAQKIRSRKRDFLHLPESNEIDFEMFIQLMVRTKEKIILDLNPSISGDANWIKDEIETRKFIDDVDVIVSNYKDNPFLTANEVRNIEALRNADEQSWRIFGLGEWGKIEGLIYDWEVIPDEDFPERGSETGEYIGLDFGFTTDPTAAVYVCRVNDTLYVKELIYERKLLNSDISTILGDEDLLIVADSAEPKSIAEMQVHGLEVVPAVKGPDSVRQGIQRVKQFRVLVSESSLNIRKEMNNYKWNSNKANVPVDNMNHAMDAIRYVVQTMYAEDGFGIPDLI